MGSSRVGLPERALAGALILVWALPACAATPCIDTNSLSTLVRRTMTVRQPNGNEIPVTGTVASLNPATGEVGIKTLGIDGEQQIRPEAIRFSTEEPSMAAQMPIPLRTPLGSISAEYPLANVTIDRGVIRYPDCAMPEGGRDTAFTGALSFGEGKLRVEGMFFGYEPPAGGGAPGNVMEKRG